MFFAALFVSWSIAEEADLISFEYLHGGGSECQTKYEYNYNLTHLNKPTRVSYSVDLTVRRDQSHSDALLYFFDNLQYSENTNQKDGEKGTLGNFPVRVSYDTVGKIQKIETNPKESDFSYHIKKGIISTLQLPWQNIQNALHDKGPLEFDKNITAKSSTCKINHLVHKMNDHEFCVTATRKIGDCDNARYFQTDYEKFQDSKKVWKYHFDTLQSKSLHHVDIDIEDYFKPEENILINSGFKYKGCENLDGEWDDKELEDIYRQFTPSEF